MLSETSKPEIFFHRMSQFNGKVVHEGSPLNLSASVSPLEDEYICL